MHKRLMMVMLVTVAIQFIINVFYGQTVFGTSPNVVISQLKAGNSSTSRMIELYNNAPEPTEVTGWCLYYSSPSNTAPHTKLGCFDEPNDLIHLFLPAHSYVLATSSETNIQSDMLLVLGLGNGTSGHVYVRDKDGIEIDRIGWGVAENAEGLHPVILPVSKVVERKKTVDLDVYIDTDDTASDFSASLLRDKYFYGTLYEILDVCTNIIGIQEVIPIDYTVDQTNNCLPPPVDICTNLDGVQTILPTGYELDDFGNCQADVCSNISGLQLIVPDNKELDASGNCVNHDMCSNIDDIQVDVPSGYRLDGLNCWLDLLPVRVSEMLPNAIGSDVGDEFIELYNPNDTTIELSQYRLQIGTDDLKTYMFPVGALLPASGYISFSNGDIPFTLVNTTSQVFIISADGQTIDTSLIYEEPYDGMSWALISGQWQFTNQPTPGNANLASLIVADDVQEIVAASLAPCASNQYRNLETNRCRMIVTASSTLTPCRDDQYRSEETNRCRSLASAMPSLISCGDDQERNPATNRCHSIVANASAGLTPCKDGQERNTETNRCRNVAKLTDVGYSVQPIVKDDNNTSGLIALGVIISIAVGYALWEWRVELVRLFFRLRSFIHISK